MAITLAGSLPFVFRKALGWVASTVSCADHSRSSFSAIHPMGPAAASSGQRSEVVANEGKQHADVELQICLGNGHFSSHEVVDNESKLDADVERQSFLGDRHFSSQEPDKMSAEFKSSHSSRKENFHDEGGTLCCRVNSGVVGSCHSLSKPLPRAVARSIRELCLGSKLSILLPLVPITLVLVHFDIGHGYIFAASLLAIAPLAERLGFVTEQLSVFTGPTVGGLLNATFGNATEMIISVLALRQNMIRVVQLSLLGSILSNMLLVLGCAFFFGGLKHPKKDQRFNKQAALVSSGLLLMAVMGLLFPAVLHATHTEIHDGKSELTLSRFSSCVMLCAYGCYLFFQLKSHRELYDCEEDSGEGGEEGADEEETPGLGLGGWIAWLGIITILISLLSDVLVDAIHGASEMWNVPVAFISVVILPIVGNAAEHASAIMFAWKDKLDISLGVAIGSSTQISMFVIPFCVVMGWISGKDMDLNFQLFETATLFSTVLVVAALLQEGKSNYFKGLMLVFSYLIVSASYWVHVDNPEDTKGRG